MEKKIVSTDKAPAAVGPYSQAVICGNLVFTAGQISLSPAGEMVGQGDIAAQAKQVLQNLKTVLEAAGSSMDKVIKTSVFLTDLGDFAAVNEIYAEFFTGKPPARSCVEVSALPKGVNIEIEAVAHL